MAIERWSDEVVVVRLADDPQFTDDLASLEGEADRPPHAVLDFSAVRFINSSNLARLLRVRKNQMSRSGKLVLCGINNTIWSTFLVTGLDQVFDFGEDVATALARIQMNKQR